MRLLGSQQIAKYRASTTYVYTRATRARRRTSKTIEARGASHTN